jgi:hypothetical protein
MLSKAELTQYIVCVSFTAALVAIFSLGVSYLVAAAQDDHDSEVYKVEEIIEEWAKYLPEFQVLKIAVEGGAEQPMMPSYTNDFSFDDDSLEYEHLKFRTNEALFPLNYQFNVVRSKTDVSLTQHNEFNWTAPLTLKVEDVTHTEDVLLLMRKKSSSNSKSTD